MSIVISPQIQAPAASPTPSTTSANGPGFAQILENVNGVLANADKLAAGFAQGKVGLTEAVVAAEHADVTLGLVVAVRNRALAAYQEIMNMTV